MNWTIYPNPVTDILYLELPSLSWTAEIMDMHGRTVYQQDNQGGNLDLSGLPVGLYVLKLRNEEGNIGGKMIQKKQEEPSNNSEKRLSYKNAFSLK